MYEVLTMIMSVIITANAIPNNNSPTTLHILVYFVNDRTKHKLARTMKIIYNIYIFTS